MKVKVMPTNFGIGLLVKALHNETPIEFVSMKFGNGDPPEDFAELADLVNPLLECSLTSYTKGDNYIEVTSSFDNNDVDSDFGMTEIGVFAIDPDLGKGMFAYVGQEDSAEPVYSADSVKLKENTVSVQIIVDNVENVTATVKSLTWATKQELEDHIHDYENPHKVKKEHLGLDQVENKKVGDTTVIFKASETLENINSGETVSTIFGKIYTALKSLLAHLTDYKNPHKVVAKDVGAAPTQHEHSASDIKTGTLGVPRGGTGVSTWTVNGVVYASAENALSQLSRPSAPSVLMQGPSGAPYFASFSSLQFIAKGSTPPTDTNLFWVDPTPITGGLKYHNGTGWVHVPVAYTV